MRLRHYLPVLVPFLAPLIVGACQSGPNDTEPLEFVHGPITSLRTDAGGVTWVGFGQMQRAFAILPQDRDILTLAKDAHARGIALHATVRRGHGQKTPESVNAPVDPQRIAVVRLATDPDPRRPAGG